MMVEEKFKANFFPRGVDGATMKMVDLALRGILEVHTRILLHRLC